MNKQPPRFGIIVNPDPINDPLWIVVNGYRGIRHISFDALPYYIYAKTIGGVCVKRIINKSDYVES